MREPAVVAVVSASTFELIGQFPVSASGPHGLDLDLQGRRRRRPGGGGSVVALDASTGSELARVSIAGAPETSWYNARLGRLSVTIKDPGVIDVVNTQAMTVDEQIAIEKGTHTTASDARLQRLYVFLPSCRAAVSEERALE